MKAYLISQQSSRDCLTSAEPTGVNIPEQTRRTCRGGKAFPPSPPDSRPAIDKCCEGGGEELRRLSRSRTDGEILSLPRRLRAGSHRRPLNKIHGP
jgi:hypothetical protein